MPSKTILVATATAVAITSLLIGGGYAASKLLIQNQRTQLTSSNLSLPPPSPVTTEPTSACWVVSTQDDVAFATLEAPCAEGPSADLPPGMHPWPQEPFRVATAASSPSSNLSTPAVTLSPALAPGGRGAILFLPTHRNGGGTYLAFWADDHHSGFVSGLFGVAPGSVATPIGRVYLTEAWLPREDIERLEPSDDTEGEDDHSPGEKKEALPPPAF